MEKIFQLILLVSLFLVISSFVSALTECNSCESCNTVIQNGEKDVVLNKTIITSGNCIEIENQENMQFRCKNNVIAGNLTCSGIIIRDGKNNTIKDCGIEGFLAGIYINHSTYLELLNFIYK